MVMSKFAGLAFGFALCTVSHAAMAQAAPEFRLCTGGEKGNYYRAGNFMKSQAASNAPIKVLTSQGSINNLEQIVAGGCDGAFVQADALLTFMNKEARAISLVERAGVLYNEYVHLLCNRKSGVNRVTDLSSKNGLAVGTEGAGQRVTWETFVSADPKRYKDVQKRPLDDERAFAAISDGTNAQCTIWVGALGAPKMKEVAQRYGDTVVLIGADDWDMGGALKDGQGRKVYGYEEIPAGTYPKIQPTGFAWGTKPVKTITTEALFVANVEWINKYPKAYDSILTAFSYAKPDIIKMVTPR